MASATSTIEPGLTCMSLEQSAVVKTLLYFGIFKYPLTGTEIHEYCQCQKLTEKQTELILADLVKTGLIKRHEHYFFIPNQNSTNTVSDTEYLIKHQQEGNKLALTYLKKASSYTRLISYFPFVEGIFLSGSLAKGFVDKDGDIDYFIITRPGRLWLCRTLLIAFKKIVLFNSHKYFCLNYFIDSKSLEVPDQNIFTATEIAFAKPMYNKDLCEHFFESNSWSAQYYPNKLPADMSKMQKVNTVPLKKIGEYLFIGQLGEKLDRWCFKLTLNHWKKKFNNFDDIAFDLNMRSKKNVSKHHPNGFQFKILARHQQEINEYEIKHNLKLNHERFIEISL